MNIIFIFLAMQREYMSYVASIIKGYVSKYDKNKR